MKRILIAGAFALMAGQQALAADLPVAPPPPPRAPAIYVPPPPLYNWSGFYLGINGGGAFGNSNWTAPLADGAFFGGACATGCSTGGALLGGTIGGNFQTGEFVLGAEADFDWSTISGSNSATSAVCASCKTSNDWLGTVRGRAGYAFDRVLVFASGGVAFGDVKARQPTTGLTNSSTEIGWTVGGGVEFAFAPNWTGKVEYLYVDLENGSCTTACGSPPSPVAVSFTANILRAGINYKFGF